jgi:hypothetical protein
VGRLMDAGHAEAVGRRPTMEDAVCICQPLPHGGGVDYYGLFDGHGGRAVSAWLAAELQHHVAATLAPTIGSGCVRAWLSAGWHGLCISYVCGGQAGGGGAGSLRVGTVGTVGVSPASLPLSAAPTAGATRWAPHCSRLSAVLPQRCGRRRAA